MCVVIIDSKDRDIFIKLGIDLDAPYNEGAETIELSEEEDIIDLLIHNIGPDKYIHGGSTYTYKGKEIQ